MPNYWVGVASLDHVLIAVCGGFCQLNHGKVVLMKRLAPGDRILYYSSRTAMRSGQSLQAFTTIGEVLDGEPYQIEQSERFRPFRRDVRYFDARETSISPLLPRLSFAAGKASWSQVMHRGTFRVDAADDRVIAEAMHVADDPE